MAYSRSQDQAAGSGPAKSSVPFGYSWKSGCSAFHSPEVLNGVPGTKYFLYHVPHDAMR